MKPWICNRHKAQYRVQPEIGKATSAAWSCVRCHVRFCACYPSFSGGHCGKCMNELDAAKQRQPDNAA